MRIDQETDGLVGQRLQLLQEHAPRLRRNVRVDDEDIILVDDDGRVRADVRRAGADRAVDAGRDLRELVSRLWRRSLRLRSERADADQAGKARQSNAIHRAQYASTRCG